MLNKVQTAPTLFVDTILLHNGMRDITLAQLSNDLYVVGAEIRMGQVYNDNHHHLTTRSLAKARHYFNSIVEQH